MMKLFEEDGSIKEVVLNEGESIDILPLKFHIHSNPFEDNSITFWKASGDITEIITKPNIWKEQLDLKQPDDSIWSAEEIAYFRSKMAPAHVFNEIEAKDFLDEYAEANRIKPELTPASRKLNTELLRQYKKSVAEIEELLK